MSATTAAAPVAATSPRRPAMDRPLAMQLAADEYARLVATLQQLTATQWQAPTCCPPWDVHAMVCHIVGMAEFAAFTRERLRQMRAAKAQGGLFIDALTGLQVAKHVQRSPAELVSAMTEIGPRAARGRRRVPAPLRRFGKLTSHTDAAGKHEEVWTLGYLFDVILTRDTWMHRSDIAAATGTEMVLTRDHDAVLVDDIVREWAGRHGQPCRVTLTGEAGGSWQFGQGGTDVTLDAVEFCRTLAGRAPADGLLATLVPF